MDVRVLDSASGEARELFNAAMAHAEELAGDGLIDPAERVAFALSYMQASASLVVAKVTASDLAA